MSRTELSEKERDRRVNVILDASKNVFLKNLDIWGFVCSYYPLFNLLYKNYDQLNENDKKLFFSLKYLFIHFLYENSTTPISPDKLIKFLNELTNLISKSLIINSNNIQISLSF